jgi:uncharacterized membrane protein HdeD (DUF308 family)
MKHTIYVDRIYKEKENYMEELITRMFERVFILILMSIAFFVALGINKSKNPREHLPFRYGYFLSVFTIIIAIYFCINSFYAIYDDYRWYKKGETFGLILLTLLGIAFLFTIAILNLKKYRLGAILVSIFTGNLVICIFYFKKRWGDLKTFDELKFRIRKAINKTNENYSDSEIIRIENWLYNYLQSTNIQKEEILDNKNTNISWSGTILDVNQSSKIINGKNIDGYFISTRLNYPLKRIKAEINITFITNDKNIAVKLTKGEIFSFNKMPFYIESENKNIKIYITIDNVA